MEVSFCCRIGVIVVFFLLTQQVLTDDTVLTPEKSKLETNELRSNRKNFTLEGHNDRGLTKNLSDSKNVRNPSAPASDVGGSKGYKDVVDYENEPGCGKFSGNGSYGPNDCPNITRGKSNMSCWSCSSLVIRVCHLLHLYGLPRRWEDELWDDCPTGYCGYYEWTLDYGAGSKIVQRECIDGNPQNFCEEKRRELQVINTTNFVKCITCRGHLCNKSKRVYEAHDSYYQNIYFVTLLFLQYKYFTR